MNDEGECFEKQRERNSRQVCAYCNHSPMKTYLTVKYPSGRTELFGLCDTRCKRYFCFQVNPEEMRNR